MTNASKFGILVGLDGHQWSQLLIRYPQFAKHCDWEKLNGHNWTLLLKYNFQFAKHCDWEKLNGYNWSQLLSLYPQLAERCKWSSLNECDWRILLCSQPQFIDKCDCFEKFDAASWNCLYNEQPSLREFINKHKDQYLIMQELNG